MKMLHHKFRALFMDASDFKCYLDETEHHRMERNGNERNGREIIKRYWKER